MEEGLFIGEGRVSLLNKKGSNSCDTVSVTSRIYFKNEDSRNIINLKPLWFFKLARNGTGTMPYLLSE